jgi:hypothetical protein
VVVVVPLVPLARAEAALTVPPAVAVVVGVGVEAGGMAVVWAVGAPVPPLWPPSLP